MGILGKIKNILGKSKDKVDDVVASNSSKIPDKAERVYNKASRAAEKVIPGEDGETS